MSKNTVARAVVRIGSGVLALALGAAVVFAAGSWALPSLRQTPVGRVVTPIALDQERACPGSLLRLAGDSGDSATTVAAVGTAQTVSGTGADDRARTTPLTGPDRVASRPLVITAPAAGTRIPQVGAAQGQTVAESDLSGFAAAPCAEPGSSTWLVGGATTTGRTTLIDLVNPSDVNATVDLSVFGENGRVDGPGLKGIVVAPRSEKAIPLSGFATDLVSPVVQVTSRGGQITATLQVSVVRTLEPGGVDIVSAAAQPERVVSIPGITVRDGAQVEGKLGSSGYDDLKTILRAYVPGKLNAQLTVQVSTADGKGTTLTSVAQAGQVTDLPLDGLPDGEYTATVTSNVRVVAGVRSSSVSTQGAVDLAWAAGAPALSGLTTFSTVDGAPVALVLANPTDRSVVATLHTLSKSGPPTATELQVPAGSSTVTALPNGATLSVSQATGLRGAVVYSDSAKIASYALVPPSAVSSPVTVFP